MAEESQVREARTNASSPPLRGHLECEGASVRGMASPLRTVARAIALAASLVVGASLVPVAANAAPEYSPRVAPTCAQGGRCVVGDVGPGGGTIIYVNREIPISNIISTDADYITVTTASPQSLVVGDRISIAGVVPTQLNVSTGVVNEVRSSTEFVLQTLLDLSAYTYQSGGVIAGAAGGWNYLQAAPQGWSGSATDPSSTVPTYAGIAERSLDWRIGGGEANTRLLRSQPQNEGVADPIDALAGLDPEWYLPSEMEMWAMFKALARDSSSAAAQGLASGSYLSSSSSYYDNALGHLWYVANFALNRTDNPGVALGSTYGVDGGRIRPVRKLWLHTAQTSVSTVKTLGLGRTTQIASVTAEGTPVRIRVLNGSSCTISAPAKQNRKTFFVLTGGKKAGSCSLRITAPETYRYWALDQTKAITIK